MQRGTTGQVVVEALICRGRREARAGSGRVGGLCRVLRRAAPIAERRSSIVATGKRRMPVLRLSMAGACLNYFRLPATAVKVEDSLSPTEVTAAMMATAIRAAISPYSMAVAPDSS